MEKCVRHIVLWVCTCMFCSGICYGQEKARPDTVRVIDRFSFRTNAFEWLVTIPNAGVEFDLSKSPYRKTTIGLTAKYNWPTYHNYSPPMVFNFSEIKPEDTVLIIGAGPTGICTLLCVMLKHPRQIIVCEKSEERIRFVQEHYPEVLVVEPENCQSFVSQQSNHGGADVVIEVAGSDDSFTLAWKCARPNAIVTVVALYDRPQVLPLPDMYGKNLTFKTGGVDGCDCAEILNLIAEGKVDTTPLITHRFPLREIEEAYRIFENRQDGVIKVAIKG